MERTSNFDHLAELDPHLAAFGGFAERYFVDDPNTALIKTRQFGERLAILIAESIGVPVDRQPAFADVLREIQVGGSAPRDVLDILHRLRRHGNVAAHDGAGDRRDAFEALKLCHRLGVWWRATKTGNPKLTIAFIPPKPDSDDEVGLATVVEALRRKLAETETAAESHRREAREAWDARLTAEERAGIAEEERAIYEALALEAERRAASALPSPSQQMAFVTAATEAARNIDLDETDTRLLIDDQLRQAGWEAETRSLRHSAGVRPQRGRNMAIAEWPTASGPADYALFVGRNPCRAGGGQTEASRCRRSDRPGGALFKEPRLAGRRDIRGWPMGRAPRALRFRHERAELLSAVRDPKRHMVP